jgi:uncharacterized protein (DUF697 family)
MDLLPVETRLIRGQARWRGAEIMPVNATEPAAVEEVLIPAVLEALHDHDLALARQLPLFRSIVADRMIGRTALVNAAYASASGLAETVPLLRMPLTAEDVEVISVNQAAMTHRLGLGYGLPLAWHETASAVGSVVEAGPLWQQLAREVVGLIPLWGVSSKVRVAYGGTVVLGRAVEAWCDTKQALSPEAVRAICREAAASSRSISAELVAKARDALPVRQVRKARPRRLKLRLPRPRLSGRRRRLICTQCGRANPPDAAFCAYCGESLQEEPSATAVTPEQQAAQTSTAPEPGPVEGHADVREGI